MKVQQFSKAELQKELKHGDFMCLICFEGDKPHSLALAPISMESIDTLKNHEDFPCNLDECQIKWGYLFISEKENVITPMQAPPWMYEEFAHAKEVEIKAALDASDIVWLLQP